MTYVLVAKVFSIILSSPPALGTVLVTDQAFLSRFVVNFFVRFSSIKYAFVDVCPCFFCSGQPFKCSSQQKQHKNEPKHFCLRTKKRKLRSKLSCFENKMLKIFSFRLFIVVVVRCIAWFVHAMDKWIVSLTQRKQHNTDENGKDLDEERTH